MPVLKTATLPSVNKTAVTESQIVNAIVENNLCSYQIGLKFGISPLKVQEIGQKHFDTEQYTQNEHLLVEELKKTIALYILTGKPKSFILKECGITSHAFEQLSNSFMGNAGFSPEQITKVIDDDDDYDSSEDEFDCVSSELKSVSLKYLDFEISFTTSKNPEPAIMSICEFLMGGNKHAS